MVLHTDRFGWRCRVIFAVEISGVSWAWQRSRTLRILQTYCKHIAADCRRLRWKTADCGGRCHGVCPVTYYYLILSYYYLCINIYFLLFINIIVIGKYLFLIASNSLSIL